MVRIVSSLIGAIALFTTMARVDAAPAAPRIGTESPLTTADLFLLQDASSALISPDERWIIYTRSVPSSMTDRLEDSLWIVDVQTGTQRRFSDGGQDVSWAPQSDRVAFVAQDAAHHAQIFIQAPTDTTPAQLTRESREVGRPVWSPDGHRIAYTVAVREPSPPVVYPVPKPAGAQWADPVLVIDWPHYLSDGAGFLPKQTHQAFVMSATGGVAKQVTFFPDDVVGNLAWSPDNKALVFSAQTTDPVVTAHYPFSHLREVVVDDAKRRELTQGQTYDHDAAISPDGRSIAFVRVEFNGSDYDRYRLMVMTRDGSNLRDLSARLDRDVGPPTWSTNGLAVFARYDDAGIGYVGRFGLDGTTTKLLDRVGGDEQFSMSSGGDIAYLDASRSSPPDLWIKPRTGAARQLTHLNAAVLTQKLIAEVRPLEVHSSFDKKPVGTWITLPPGFRTDHRYPTILSIHGGPHGANDDAFQISDQLLAARGYVVVSPNYRGSTSYGLAFASSDIKDKWPDIAYKDLMSAVDAAIAGGFSDPRRLFVTGGSAGGMLAAWIVGSKHRFSAAVIAKPIVDAASNGLSSDQYQAFISDRPKKPWEDHAAFWRASPLSLISNVDTPTMIVIGDLDRRTPLTQSLAYYNALRLRGVPSQLVVVPGAGHDGMRDRISQNAAIELETMRWLARHGGVPLG